MNILISWCMDNGSSVERCFLMNSQWTDKRNRMLIKSIRYHYLEVKFQAF